MLKAEQISEGLALLATAFDRSLTPELVKLYAAVLSPHLDAAAWEQAVRRALEAETRFPAPAVLIRYGTALGPARTRAMTAYNSILDSFESGHELGPREVLQKFGRAAMDSFVAAGGVAAFGWCEPRDEPFRRKAFVEAWAETVQEDPQRALPPGERPLLGGGR